MQERGNRDTDFVTLCHGEPWIGSVYFKFDKEDNNNNNIRSNNQQQQLDNSSEKEESKTEPKSAESSSQEEEETDSNQVCFMTRQKLSKDSKIIF